MQIGDRFKMTHRLYSGAYMVYEVIDFVRNTGQGTIQLKRILEQEPNQRPNYKESIFTVEVAWFDEKLTGRKITPVSF